MSLMQNLEPPVIEFNASTSVFTNKLMISKSHAKNRKQIGGIPQPATTKRQRADVGGIPGELIQQLATEIQTDVANKFGVHLEFEVNIW
jgi:hypothetical protein